ncbi:unnamed protein product [Cuscuta epithymum]|uniref:Uncharacterized protein n=1 Tax=Cuscuta epithymum TaxID=186058 RepID=A0AAV0C1B1_9ASTE|nr:unnamed protein product [Cuscuta epithymum]
MPQMFLLVCSLIALCVVIVSGLLAPLNIKLGGRFAGKKLLIKQMRVEGKKVHIKRECWDSNHSDEEDCSDTENLEEKGGCLSSSSNPKVSISKDLVQTLMNGDIQLPYSELFPLPPIVSCLGGCE